jgi:hypothetical protein
VPDTIAVLLDRTLAAFDALCDVADPIADELQYVTDLSTVWRGRLGVVRAARGNEPADASISAAVDAVVREAGRIADPHRAIDWLSTVPQVVLVALGEAT